MTMKEIDIGLQKMPTGFVYNMGIGGFYIIGYESKLLHNMLSSDPPEGFN